MPGLRAAVLGATGMVGQRLVSLLDGHPRIEVSVLAASERSAGNTYSEACKWVIQPEMPGPARNLEVLSPDSTERIAGNADIVFSALPSSASAYESRLAQRLPVISKSSAHRMDPDVPLIIPGVNDDHLGMIRHQQKARNTDGFISCDPNCSSTQLAVILHALSEFQVENVFVDSMQAVSGSGYPGIPLLDIQDNVIPYIEEEEAKLKREPRKILGRLDESVPEFQDLDVRIMAKANRVNVTDGHLQSIFVKLGKNFSEDDAVCALKEYRPSEAASACYSFPEKLIIVRDEIDRPQPKFDRNAGSGMSVVAGRIEKDGEYLKLSCLSHNTILGAAGGAILHAELLDSLGYFG